MTCEASYLILLTRLYGLDAHIPRCRPPKNALNSKLIQGKRNMAGSTGIGAFAQVFKIPNYRYYTIGNFASQLGMWVQRVAVAWLTWELTKSPFWLGLVAFADFMPNLVLAPLAGAVADRFDRLKAMRLYMAISAIISSAIAGLTITGLITVEILALLVLANGIAMSFNFPARLAIIHALVGQDTLTTAINTNAIVFNFARI